MARTRNVDVRLAENSVFVVSVVVYLGICRLLGIAIQQFGNVLALLAQRLLTKKRRAQKTWLYGYRLTFTSNEAQGL